MLFVRWEEGLGIGDEAGVGSGQDTPGGILEVSVSGVWKREKQGREGGANTEGEKKGNTE